LTGCSEPRENQSGTLEQAFSTLERLAAVGGSLDSEARRGRAWQSAEGGGDSTAAAAFELKERHLSLAETSYRVLIEQIPAVTFIASLTGDTNEIYVSPQIESLLGFTQEEWVSNPILWYTQTHPDDRECISRDFATAIMSGRPFRSVIRVFSREGVMRWVKTEARFVRDERGLPILLHGAGFDVTEQFRAQEAREQLVREQAARAEADRERQRLQQVFTNLPAAIAVLRGPDHLVEFLNPVASTLAEVGTAVIGKPWIEAFPEFGVDTVSALDTVIATGEPCFLREYRAYAARWGGDRYFNLVFQPLPRPKRQRMVRLMYAVDVTAQVHARREVEQALELREEAIAQMRETLKMREEFLAAAAHDLKNPITIIKARAQLLKRQITRMAAANAERVVESAASIESNAARMTAMIGELLDLARLQSGQSLRLDRRPTDLVAIVRQTVADHQQRTNRHNIRIETTERELIGSWDPVRVTRVLSNLLENAIKYSPKGGDIVVTVGYDAHASGYAMFRVQDFGVGIREADLPRVFERFYRGTNVVGRIAGTGLGLTGSHQIVQAHGGSIDVDSQEGAGSTFTVRLPIMEK
jgi:PAS domain S-box-containing protein